MKDDMKQRIADTLVALAGKKEFDKITVKELADACQISRQTFYYYYQDIIEVLEWRIQQKIKENVEICLQIEDEHESMINYIQGIEQAKPMLNRVLNSRLRDESLILLLKHTKAYTYRLMERTALHVTLDREELDFLVDFFSCGLMGMVYERRYETTANIEKLCDLASRTIRDTLERTQKNQNGTGS